jgi:hypothetical protein
MKDGKLEGKDVVNFPEFTVENYKQILSSQEKIEIFPNWDDDHSQDFHLPVTIYLDLLDDAIKYLQTQKTHLEIALWSYIYGHK